MLAKALGKTILICRMFHLSVRCLEVSDGGYGGFEVGSADDFAFFD
jgi:hypothetical protein